MTDLAERAPATGGGADDYTAWVGRTDEATDVISATPARALLATLDREPTIHPGDPLPPLFHWLYCRELTRGSRLDGDGHQKRGEFLPRLPLPRRMWAGGRITLSGPLLIGESVRRVSTVKAVTPKMGRSGRLIVVMIEHRVTGESEEVVEEQDLVFLERPTEPLVLPDSDPPDDEMGWSERITPDVPMLFRFSALTFNAHRIHYDHEFARGVEFYPDLVVHGPLTALLLADLAHRRADGRLSTFSFRARRPMFVDREITLEGRDDGGKLALRARDDTGAVAMTAVATLA